MLRYDVIKLLDLSREDHQEDTTPRNMSTTHI